MPNSKSCFENILTDFAIRHNNKHAMIICCHCSQNAAVGCIRLAEVMMLQLFIVMIIPQPSTWWTALRNHGTDLVLWEYVPVPSQEELKVRVMGIYALVGLSEQLPRQQRGSNLFSSSTPNSKVHGPTWGPSGADRTQVSPMLAPWTLLSGTWGIYPLLLSYADILTQ